LKKFFVAVAVDVPVVVAVAAAVVVVPVVVAEYQLSPNAIKTLTVRQNKLECLSLTSFTRIV
jgi:hypothetical protein